MNARRAGAIVLNILAWAFRLAAIVMCAITVVLCFPGMSAKLNLVGLIVDLSRSIPSAVAGYGVIASPLGGVFRFDFALIAVVCFALDYLCLRLSHSLRR